MVHWNDPTVVSKQLMLVISFAHLFDGVYLCECVFRCRFALDFFTGKRVVKWPFVLYAMSRWSTLAVVVCELVGYAIASEYNCVAWSTIIAALSGCAFALAHMLLVLRAIAVWNRNIWVMVVSIAVWLCNVACMLYGLYVNTARWNSVINACFRVDTARAAPVIITGFLSNLVLLALCLGGVLRSRYDGALWRLVYTQGIFCTFIATISGLPGSILVLLNLNDAMNQLFVTPALIMMTMCTTRMYRQLMIFGTTGNQPSISTNSASSMSAIMPAFAAYEQSSLGFSGSVPQRKLSEASSMTLDASVNC